jgi:RNA polymerase sigma-70 factor (ECF subfamily)
MDKSHTMHGRGTVHVLLESHRKFLAFLERRTGSSQVAEDILQAAYAKAVEQEDRLRQETVVAWFYRLLRNALVDYYRRQDVERRALETRGEESPGAVANDVELERTICECLRDLLTNLKPEYREILQRVDLGESSVSDAARSLGVTTNNAGVRLHRARLALKAQLEESCRTCAAHGCLDCTCKKC